MKQGAFVFLLSLVLSACKHQQKQHNSSIVPVARGEMPAVARDNDNVIHVVYGRGDSLMYTFSDNKGVSFSAPQLIDTLQDLVAYATRGPQVFFTKNGLVALAVNKQGNIYSFVKNQQDGWVRSSKVNDKDTIDKEGFLGLSGDGVNNLFAIWTDLRNDRHNKIYGAASEDGGKSWQKNILVYASPDSTVCECCKPSVVMSGSKVFVMFRNWLHGNRDLYIIQSADKGQTFNEAQKLGKGSWSLNGCPMDGGGQAINNKNVLQTVWRRKSRIYTCELGKDEREIGEGKGCTIETIDSKNMFAWSHNSDIICLFPDGSKRQIGKGSLPVLKSMGNHQVICIWENDKQIQSLVMHL